MKQIYKAGTKKHLSFSRGEKFGLIGAITILLILVFILLAYLIIKDIKKSEVVKGPLSKKTIEKVNFDSNVVATPYFNFRDSGNWRYAEELSTNSKVVVIKYLGQSKDVQHLLTAYINEEPPIPELASSRVLPVNIVGRNLSPTQVSDACGVHYSQNEPRKVMLRSLDSVIMPCDPDNSQYKVILGTFGINYHLKLTRANGQVAQYIIIYENETNGADANTILQVAKTFQAQ
jgi:hypothetical protein